MENLFTQNNPVGVDVVIDKLQRDLFLELTKKFGWRTYQSFPRIYRNVKGKDTIPEVYIGSDEYKDVLFDDTKTANSFFLIDDKRIYDDKKFAWTQGVALIIQANLNRLWPECKSRQDETLIDNVRRAIKNRHWDTKLEQIITGVEEVYKSLKISYDKKNFDNMSNFFIVRFDFKLAYTNTDKTQVIQ